MDDNLGNRMKTNYENVTRMYLPRRTYTIIRIDGKSFHNYCKKLNKPFDLGFIESMNNTALYLCNNIMGVKFCYVQSDEISLLLTDFDKLETEAWFGGNIQKMVSVSASMATSFFNREMYAKYLVELEDLLTAESLLPKKDAEFDSRVFTIPSLSEVKNYFIWRQQDCIRNSISSYAQSMFSNKQLHQKNSNEQKEMCALKGNNWDELDGDLKYGRIITKKLFNIQRNNIDIERYKFVISEPCILYFDCNVFSSIPILT